MFAEFWSEYGMTLIYTVLTAILGFVGIAVKKIIAKFTTDKTKEAVVRTCVNAAELLREISSWVYLKDITVVSASKKGIAVGSTVTIKKGAVYGGLSGTRGKLVPAAQLAPTKHKVSKIQTNKGVKEALLSDISSWVAVSNLTEV